MVKHDSGRKASSKMALYLFAASFCTFNVLNFRLMIMSLSSSYALRKYSATNYLSSLIQLTKKHCNFT